MLVDDLVDRHHPAGVGVVRGGRLEQVAGVAGPGVEPTEPALARLEVDVGHDLGGRGDDAIAHVDLAVVGGDDQDRARWQHLEDVGDEAVDRVELGVVELVEPVLVGDLVDALVVGVDERLARRSSWATSVTERGGDPPAGEAGAVEVGQREAGVAELGLGDDRRPLAGEGARGSGPCRAGCSPGRRGRRGLPPQHVEHLAVDGHAVADDAVRRPARGPW